MSKPHQWAYAAGKRAYYALPFKKPVFDLAKRVWRPSRRMAAYLKFNAPFTLRITSDTKLSLWNDRSTIPTLLYWHGVNGYEPVSLQLWAHLSTQARTIIDAGANFGLFGLIAKTVNPAARVVFVEALDRNCQRINRNQELNHMAAAIIPKALGNKETTVTFYDMAEHDNTIGSLSRDFVEGHKHHKEIRPITVPMTQLDTIVEQEALETVDLIKVDVEGAEVLVLEGAAKTIQSHRPDILIEVASKDNAERINALIRHWGIDLHVYELSDTSGVVRLPSLQRLDARNYLLSTKAGLDKVPGLQGLRTQP